MISIFIAILDFIDLLLTTSYSIKSRFQCITPILSSKTELQITDMIKISLPGLKGDVQKGLVDIGFAGMWAVASNFNFFDFTQPYSYDYFIFLVPLPQIRPYWLTYFLAFEYRIWLFLLTTTILSVLTLVLLKNVRAAPDPVLDDTSTYVLLLHLFGLFFYNSHERTLKIK